MTSQTVLPPQLAARQAAYAAALHEEIQPQTAVEFIFVNEIARHAAALDVATGAEAAALRVTSQSNELLLSLSAADVNPEDQLIVGAVGSEATDRICRYRRGHERALQGAFRALAECRTSARHQPSIPLPTFSDEVDCVGYLRDWQSSREWSCPRCRHAKRCFLQNRQRFECQGCGRQHSVRSGTILERSRLPVMTWFRVILAIISNPSLQVADLAAVSNVARPQTLTMLQTKILEAMRSPDREMLLAGLSALNRQANGTCASRSKIKLPDKTRPDQFSRDS